MAFKFHFLNVGDGDCTIIDFPERRIISSGKEIDNRVMMIDIHHHDDHDDYEHVIDYYQKNFKDNSGLVKPIFRYVSTHPHKDHLKGLNNLLDSITVVNFWDIEHEFEPDQNGPDWDEYKDDWERYVEIRKNKTEPRALFYTDTLSPLPYWDEDRIEILSPSKELYDFVHTKEDGTKRTKEEIGVQLNNLSYVLLIHVNDLKIVLAGDAEPKCWEYILKNHKDKIKDIDILKAPHHGRESAFHEEAVKWMNPRYIVFSASEDCEHTVPEKYEKAASRGIVYNTSELGSFILDCDFDGKITLV